MVRLRMRVEWLYVVEFVISAGSIGVVVLVVVFFFFFQAEDGIRDATVTGVQTCALPIQAEGHTRCYRDWSSDVCSSDRKSTRLNSRHGRISYAVFCLDRKSTRLNSSHGSISYAVFCLDPKRTRLYFTP